MPERQRYYSSAERALVQTSKQYQEFRKYRREAYRELLGKGVLNSQEVMLYTLEDRAYFTEKGIIQHKKKPEITLEEDVPEEVAPIHRQYHYTYHVRTVTFAARTLGVEAVDQGMNEYKGKPKYEKLAMTAIMATTQALFPTVYNSLQNDKFDDSFSPKEKAAIIPTYALTWGIDFASGAVALGIGWEHPEKIILALGIKVGANVFSNASFDTVLSHFRKNKKQEQQPQL